MTHALHIQLLGGFQLLHGDDLIVVRSNRLQSLLAYLLLHRHSPQPRQQIAAQFWPDSRESQARANLRKLLHQLRKTLPQSSRLLQFEVDIVQWRVDAPFSCDVAAFEEAASRARTTVGKQQRISLEQAVDLYRGDLLPACYDDWIWSEREKLRQIYGEVLDELVQLLAAQREYRRAIRYARHLCQFDPLREAAYRQLMRLYSLSGDRAGAIETYQRCEQRLQDELAVEPSAATRDLYARILDEERLKQHRHNLPQQLTSFIGREGELLFISERLQDEDCRLLTLTGPGGMGKTRLALQGASELVDEYADGVFFASLEPVSSPNLLVAALAEALDFSFYEPGDPKQQLLDYLREKQLLIVLDNFEHLLDAAGLLAELLGQTESVKLLVTSRERLKLPQEWLLELDGLPWPADAADERLEAYGAVQLLLQRARQVRSQSAWTDPEKEAVVRICQQLEGLPLGLELAAAWLRVFSLTEIETELSRNLDVLDATRSDLPPRHRSLRAVFEQSWSFLSAAERRLWRKLAIFLNSFDRRAAAQVTGAAPSSLMAFVDKSLLQIDGSGLFSLHGLVRQYGLEKLSAHTEEWTATREAHAAYYLSFLHEHHQALWAEGQRDSLAEIAAAIDDVRAAWEWAVSNDQLQLQLMLDAADALARFYEVRGWFEEGRERYAQAVARVRSYIEARPIPSDEEARLLARMLIHEGFFRLRLGDFSDAAARLEESMALGEQIEAGRELATAATWLAEVYYRQGDYAEALPLCHKALAHSRPLRRLVDSMRALSILGQVEFARGRFEEAQRFFEESRALCAETGDRWALAHLHNNLGTVSHELGRYQTAWGHFETSLSIFRDLDDRWGQALVTNNMGQSALLTERLDEAGEWLEESLALRREFGNRWAIAFVLNNLARLDLHRGRYVQARLHAEESLDIRRQFGDRPGVASCLVNLGDIELALDKALLARRCYREGLETAVEIQNDSLAVSALLGMAKVLSHHDNDEDALALELAVLVAAHPAATDTIRAEAEDLAAEQATHFPRVRSEEWRRRVRARALPAVAADLLARLAQT